MIFCCIGVMKTLFIPSSSSEFTLLKNEELHIYVNFPMFFRRGQLANAYAICFEILPSLMIEISGKYFASKTISLIFPCRSILSFVVKLKKM